MDLKTKKEDIEKRFEECRKNLIQNENIVTKLKEEILRIQGEFRLIEELIKQEPE